jgi:hypothetical protein
MPQKFVLEIELSGNSVTDLTRVRHALYDIRYRALTLEDLIGTVKNGNGNVVGHYEVTE